MHSLVPKALITMNFTLMELLCSLRNHIFSFHILVHWFGQNTSDGYHRLH